ncbi:MAG: hypothetical protein V1663_05290 [archaeon]
MTFPIVPVLCATVSFLLVLFLTPWLIRYLRRVGLIVKDENKEKKPLVPISGGLSVMAGVFVGLMLYISTRTFIYKDTTYVDYIFAGISSILIITFIGFVDDLIINKSKSESRGLKQWQKPLLTLAAALPLMVVNAGDTIMSLPLIGRVDIGLIYPLILIPIGVVGAANMVNMLAGFNGLETGLGIVYIGMLGLYAFVNNSYLGALFSLIGFSSLLAFYIFNKYPAKILPGDSLTYLIGALIACIAIIGNLERAALISAVPFFIEFILKARKRFNAKSYGYYKYGKIKSYYDKIYSIPHIFTRTGRFTEKQVVFFVILIQLFFSSLIWVL